MQMSPTERTSARMSLDQAPSACRKTSQACSASASARPLSPSSPSSPSWPLRPSSSWLPSALSCRRSESLCITLHHQCFKGKMPRNSPQDCRPSGFPGRPHPYKSSVEVEWMIVNVSCRVLMVLHAKCAWLSKSQHDQLLQHHRPVSWLLSGILHSWVDIHPFEFMNPWFFEFVASGCA